ncbi:hypothetical protein SBC1_48260 (plasmid) [Caballeronia sp. SBC1]|nr:hypothetical protein SBC2_39710 [Caballeronia sp. SBC2]QIN64786.1 hypothetical protein SBC1_48260 [Caballeronia sp. SBC1]
MTDVQTQEEYNRPTVVIRLGTPRASWVSVLRPLSGVDSDNGRRFIGRLNPRRFPNAAIHPCGSCAVIVECVSACKACTARDRPIFIYTAWDRSCRLSRRCGPRGP